MGDPRFGTAPEVATAIARYLLDHPDAADNLKGVVECWLNRDAKDGAFLALAEQALDLLVKSGEVERVPIGDGGLLYRKPRPR